MALSLWNATGNVQTWFHRLSMREGGFTTSYEDLGDFDEDFRIQKKLATKICEFIFENDIALLTVEIAQPRILELVKDIKVTFPDMLGTIGKKKNEHIYPIRTLKFYEEIFSGGTIGLFTGLSLISVVEVVYWVYKTIEKYFSRNM